MATRQSGNASVLNWLRGKRRTTATANVLAYDSRCGRYRVEVHTSMLECERGKRGARRKRWYPLVKINDRFEFVLPHVRPWKSTRAAAERSCNNHAKKTETS